MNKHTPLKQISNTLFLLLFYAILPSASGAEENATSVADFVKPEPVEWPDWVKAPTKFKKSYYVCPTGDDSNPGTIEKPWASYEKAIERLSTSWGGDAILLCRGGEWKTTEYKIIRNGSRCSGKNYCYMGAYGEGAKPKITMSRSGHIMFEGARGFYFHDLHFQGEGYRVSKHEAFRLWDQINYLVFNNVTISEFALGFNVSEGRMNPRYPNTHVAVVNSEGYWNSSGFFHGGVSNHTFLDGNIASNNGGFGGAHNYYLAGHHETQAKNYVFQRNISRSNAPRDGKNGGGCSRGAFVAHGYIDNLKIIDNIIEEQKNTSEGGCWGLAVDEGRLDTWGVENFPNLVMTGNIVKYTGNLNISLTNSDDALIGWNTVHVDATLDAIGIMAPSKRSEDPETAIQKLNVVHNKIYLEGEPRNTSSGIIMNIPQANLEHNEIYYENPDRIRCFVVNGDELADLGTNSCQQMDD